VRAIFSPEFFVFLYVFKFPARPELRLPLKILPYSYLFFFTRKVDLFASPTALKKYMLLLPKLSTLNLVECKIYKQYKVSLLFYFLFFLLYILSESKKRIHGF
jgi:hypothetical protein